MKKIIVIAVCAALAFTLAACGGTTSQTPALLAENGVLFTIDGEYEVSRDMLEYYVLTDKLSADSGNNDYWHNRADQAQAVIDGAVESYRYQYALLCWADELGLGVSDADAATAAQLCEQAAAAAGGDEAFAEQLAAQYLTRESYERGLSEQCAVDRLNAYLASDECELLSYTDAEAQQYIADNSIMAAKHILIKNDSGESAADNLAIAELLLQQIQNGADFDAIMNQYSEDTGLANYPDGYTFTAGTMVASFEDAVAALEPGEISGVVESEYGYHIIMRLPVSSDYVAAEMRQLKYDEYVNGYMDAQQVEYADGFAELTLTDFKWAY